MGPSENSGFYARPLIVVNFFRFFPKISGGKNWGLLLEILVLVGLGRSGRLIGSISTYFHQKRMVG